jgi:micrococcal nuclease
LRQEREAEPTPARPPLARLLALAAVLAAAFVGAASSGTAQATVFRVDHVADGDTITLRNGQRVRLVQIDTPEVFFGAECYGPQASATAKRLLPPGTLVRLFPEPAGDRVDDFGRLLRYVIRADGLNVNLRLVALGAAAPYFYEGQRGRYAARLEALALNARRQKRGLWKICPRTVYDPYRGIETRR